QIALLQSIGLVALQARHLLHEGGHPPLDLAHEAGLDRVEGVVEVEQPGADVGQVGGHLRTSVPDPCSVNSSTSMACGLRPSRMTTASTPASTAAMAVSSLGIIPPVATLSSIAWRASATVIWRIRLRLA